MNNFRKRRIDMLGWVIFVYRCGVGSATEKRGPELATWVAGLNGLDWVDNLVEKGKAVGLGGDVYPSCYSAQASTILPIILSGPPRQNDIFLKNYERFGPYELIQVVNPWSRPTLAHFP